MVCNNWVLLGIINNCNFFVFYNSVNFTTDREAMVNFNMQLPSGKLFESWFGYMESDPIDT